MRIKSSYSDHRTTYSINRTGRKAPTTSSMPSEDLLARIKRVIHYLLNIRFTISTRFSFTVGELLKDRAIRHKFFHKVFKRMRESALELAKAVKTMRKISKILKKCQLTVPLARLIKDTNSGFKVLKNIHELSNNSVQSRLFKVAYICCHTLTSLISILHEYPIITLPGSILGCASLLKLPGKLLKVGNKTSKLFTECQTAVKFGFTYSDHTPSHSTLLLCKSGVDLLTDIVKIALIIAGLQGGLVIPLVTVELASFCFDVIHEKFSHPSPKSSLKPHGYR